MLLDSGADEPSLSCPLVPCENASVHVLLLVNSFNIIPIFSQRISTSINSP